MTTGVIEAVTYAAGEALNAAGGVRMTRLARAADKGDAYLVVERSLGLPATGLVQVGGVTYHYGALADGALLNLTVITPQGTFSDVQMAHPQNTLVIDASRSHSALDLIRAGLFVDTATGEDLSILGRILGVPRLADVADDDVYRALIKAIAYGPRPTRMGLAAALDALVGPGHYLLTEDPDAPGVVQVVLDAGELLDNVPIGKFYLSDRRAGTKDGSSITTKGPLLHVHAVSPADTDFCLTATRTAFADRTVTDEMGTTYRPLTQSSANAFSPSTVFVDVPAYSSDAPGYLSAAGVVDDSGQSDVAAQMAVMDPAALSATDGRRFMLRLSDGSQAVSLGLFASGARISVALCDANGVAASMLGAFDKQQVASLRLKWDHAGATAQVLLDGKLIYIGPVLSHSTNLSPGAYWGCFANQAAFVTLLQVATCMRSTADLGLASVSDVTRDPVTITTQKPLPAGMDRYVVRGDVVRSGQLTDGLGAINHRLTDGPPPTYLLWPAYLNEPTHLAQTYLQNMVALGVQVRVTQGLEGRST